MSALTKLRRRGGATVELAISMIVLIPTIFYTMYLEDLLAYKLEQEEAVTSATWDMSVHDYRKYSRYEISGSNANPGSSKVVQKIRFTYADHTAAWNSYGNYQYDLDNNHHNGAAMAAHQCWMASGGQQVSCEWEVAPGMMVEPTFGFKNHGGLAYCDAQLGVQNYFIPNQFFEWIGRKKIKDGNQEMKTWTGGDEHANAKSDTYLFPKMSFGAIHDTWALYKQDDVDPTMHPMEQMEEWVSWIRIPYGLRAGKLSDANQFADDAIQKEILGNQVKIDGMGDTLLTPPLAFKKAAQREVNGHYTSAWTDQRHQNTQQTMENKYMGQAETSW